MDTRFFTAGDAIFTVSRPDGTHQTYRIQKRAATAKYAETFFVKVLTGPDNESNYTYLGVFNPADFTVRLTAKSGMAADAEPVRLLVRVLLRVKAGQMDAVRAAGYDVAHAGRCCRCARLLTTPQSVAAGVGPDCADQMGWVLPKAAGVVKVPAPREVPAEYRPPQTDGQREASAAVREEKRDAWTDRLEEKAEFARLEAEAEERAYREEMELEDREESGYYDATAPAGWDPYAAYRHRVIEGESAGR